MPGGEIAAVILAAGMSRRMGRPKMLLPWAGKTVIETVATTLAALDLSPIVVVTGGTRGEVEAALVPYPVQCVLNPLFENGEMLDSIRVGLHALPERVNAVLVALGDQPQIETSTVTALLAQYSQTAPLLLLPSYQMRRGHPWLISRRAWEELLALRPPQTMRDFFRQHTSRIQYVEVDSPSVLADLDTPQDYEKQRPDAK